MTKFHFRAARNGSTGFVSTSVRSKSKMITLESEQCLRLADDGRGLWSRLRRIRKPQVVQELDECRAIPNRLRVPLLDELPVALGRHFRMKAFPVVEVDASERPFLFEGEAHGVHRPASDIRLDDEHAVGQSTLDPVTLGER
ncbi:MAG: hypothetical protein OXU32_14155 [Gammaproteobacteria bacterium]|nr:hypothetical protein [Gammaproteobacteria bacterium]